MGVTPLKRISPSSFPSRISTLSKILKNFLRHSVVGSFQLAVGVWNGRCTLEKNFDLPKLVWTEKLNL